VIDGQLRTDGKDFGVNAGVKAARVQLLAQTLAKLLGAGVRHQPISAGVIAFLRVCSSIRTGG